MDARHIARWHGRQRLSPDCVFFLLFARARPSSDVFQRRRPEATGLGENMAIFVDQLSPSSILQLVSIIKTIAIEAVEPLLKKIP